MDRKIKIAIALIILIFLSPYTNAGIFYSISRLNTTEKKELQKKVSPFIPRLKLSAIASSQGKKVALINGKYLKEGDKISNCTVTKIKENPPSTILYCDGIKVELKIDLIKSEETE